MDLALECGYIDKETYEKLDDMVDHVIGQIVRMESSADKWVISDEVMIEY